MPFKSKAQRRKFYAMASRGEISPKVVKEWEDATPKNKKLPERIMKKKAFWEGFAKKAQTYVSAPSQPGMHERSLLWNDLHGVDPRTPEDAQVASAVDLITLPADVEGASCMNCVNFRMLDPDLGSGFCMNPDIKQDVTVRMHCSQWDNPAVARSWEDVGTQMPIAPEGADEITPDGIMADFQNPEVVGNPGTGGQDVASESAPAPQNEIKSAPESDKKPKEKKTDGHTVNINVGEKKTAALFKSAWNSHMAIKRLGQRRVKSVSKFIDKAFQ